MESCKLTNNNGGEWRYGPEDQMLPVVLPLEYRIYGVDRVYRRGSGRTLKLSTDKVLFESDLTLGVGLEVDLSIAWPALSSESAALTLRLKGRIGRANRNLAELTTEHYEFRISELSALTGQR
ncbi:MAG: hypothetical protein ABSB15_04825 [Bryobacteraceae bacterium]